MPALPRRVTNATVYLYRTEVDALSGSAYGASGFIVGEQAHDQRFRTDPGQTAWHLYAVTAGHVIDQGCTVIRQTVRQPKLPLMNVPGGVTTPLQWIQHATADVAIAQLGLLMGPPLHRRLKWWIDRGWLVTDNHRDGMEWFGGPTGLAQTC